MPGYESHQAATLARGLKLLQCFAPGESRLGNGELAARTGLDKATVSRLTYTLVELGYLRRDAALRKYRLGPAVLMMAYPLIASMRIRHVARPLMKELATSIHGIVGLGIRDRADIVYVEAAYPPHVPPPAIDRGVTVPVVASAIGRAWLARASQVDRGQASNQARVRAPATYPENAPRLPRAYRELDARGYCVSRGYRSPNRQAVAVPLSSTLQGELFVFNCASAGQGAGTELPHSTMGPRLVEMVGKVEAAMGIG